jgi:Tfp pilus assembly protein PilZ
MLENRRHFRLREFMEVTWRVADQDISGEGLIMNISLSGLLLQTDRVFRPLDNCVLSIEEPKGTELLPFSSKKGKVMWLRRISTPQERFQCGIKFLENYTDQNFKQWLEMKIYRLSQAEGTNILNNLAF